MSRTDRHNEMNPDMRSFGSKGTSSINPHDEADRKYQDEQDEIRSNADEPDYDNDSEDEDDAAVNTLMDEMDLGAKGDKSD